MNLETNFEYWRIFKFPSANELNEFEKLFEKYNKQQVVVEPDVKQEIKPVENRGSKTKELHKKIKEYIVKNPNIKYRDALKDYKNIVKQ